MRAGPFIMLAWVGALSLLSGGCIVVVKGGDEVEVNEHRKETPRLGVELADVSSATASQAGVDATRSCMITSVSFGSSAERAGLQRYDIVTHIDGRDYATVSALREAVRSRRPGESLVLTVVRAGKAQDVTVTLESP